MNHKSTLIVSTDADIPTDLGDRCVVVNIFTGKRLRIATTSDTTRQDILNALGTSAKARAKPQDPKYPLYEGVTCMKLRALISVILGYDVCPVESIELELKVVGQDVGQWQHC